MPSRLASNLKATGMSSAPNGAVQAMAVDDSPPPGRDESEFQKANKLIQYVPYSANLQTSRENLWANLQKQLATAIVSQGQPLLDWIYACEQYLTAFGFAFSKSDHIILIKVCWQCLFSIEHDFSLMRRLTKLLSRLLSNTKLLSRSDLKLNWRQLFDLLELTQYSSHARKQTILFEPEFAAELKELTAYSRPYFAASATCEMLDDWKQYMCSYTDKFRKYLSRCKLFFPTMLPPEEHKLGFKLWFEPFMNMLLKEPNQEIDIQSCYNQLFSSLAQFAIGYIDWQPYIAILFQRFQKSINGLMMLSGEVNITARWIIYMIYPGSSCFKHMKQLFEFKHVETRNMLTALMDEFIKRLRSERYAKKKVWYDTTPDSYKLTDENVIEFGQFMFEQYEKLSGTFTEFDVEYLYNLSLFCSERLPGEVVDKLSLAHERFFEPTRLQPALQLFSISLYHMVKNEKIGPTHRTHVIPIMSKLVHSLNTNDHALCYLHIFAIRSVVILGLPLENLSVYAEEKKATLSKKERKQLQQTVAFEEFAMDFLNACLTIIESNNEDLFNFSKKGLAMKTLLWDTLSNILALVSKDKFKALTDKYYRYITTRIFENPNVLYIIQKGIQAFVMADHVHSSGDESNATYNRFFKGVTAKVIETIDDKAKFSDMIASEFTYYMSLFAGCFYDGNALLAHRPQLLALFRRLFAIDFNENSQQISLITNCLCGVFNFLLSTYPNEQCFSPKGYHVNRNNPDFVLEQFLTWPHELKLSEIPNRWYEPTEEAIEFTRELYREFIHSQMDLLEKWTKSEVEVNKAQLEKSLAMILSFSGFRDVIPRFSDEKAAHVELYFTDRDSFAIDLFNGENFRDHLVILTQKILLRLKDSPSDNVSALKFIIKILDYALFPADSANTSNPNDFSLLDEFAPEKLESLVIEEAPKNIFNSIYQTIEKKKESIPMLHYTRIAEYHLKMLCTLKCWSNAQMTPSHELTIELLLDLATCSSTEVRMDAQAILFDVIESLPKSAQLLVPKLSAHLRNHASNYDAYKGTLYLLLGTPNKSFFLSDNWSLILQLWPALIETNFVEKPKIVDLLDNDLLPLFAGYYFTIPIETSCVSAKFTELFHQLEGSDGAYVVPKAEEIRRLEALIAEGNQANDRLYNALIDKLKAILDDQQLHWRYYILGLSLLSFLIRYDRPFPIGATHLFLDNLVHDSVKIRMVASSGLKKILSLLKPQKTTETVTIGQIAWESLPMDTLTDRATYESAVFYDKPHFGFYPDCQYTVRRVPKSRDASFDEEFTFIRDKFMEEAFIDKIFDLHSIEREKNEQIDSIMEAIDRISDLMPIDTAGLGMFSNVSDNLVKVFQYLFESFGLFNSHLLFPRITALLEEGKTESEVKLAVEILVGMLKATPVYDYEEVVQLKAFLVESVFAGLPSKINKEMNRLWDYLFTSTFDNLDYRRYAWFEEYLFAENLFTESMTMACQTAYLNFFANTLLENWRYSQVSERVLRRLEANLSYKYQTVRIAIASLLNKSIFNPCVGFNHQGGLLPRQADFIDRIWVHFDKSLNRLLIPATDEAARNMASVKSEIFNNESEDGQELANSIETICSWLQWQLMSKNFSESHSFIKLLPYLAVIHTTNKTVQSVVTKVISTLSVVPFNANELDNILERLQVISRNWNWHTRNEVAIFVSNFAFTNISLLGPAKPGAIESLLDLTLTLLADERIDVRKTARKALSGFICYSYIPQTRKDELIGQFKGWLTESGNVKHAGALGLGAFVMAYPRLMPTFLPDIVLHLVKHLNDPAPVGKSINEVLKTFMKTHQDNWVEHKQKFTTEQLAELSDVSIFSSYIS